MTVKRIYTARMKSAISEEFRQRNEDFAASLLVAVRSGRFNATFESIWSYRARKIMEEMNESYDIPPDDDVFIYNLVDGIFRPAVTEGYTPDPQQIIAMAQPLEEAAEELDRLIAASAAKANVKPGPTQNRPGKGDEETGDPNVQNSVKGKVLIVREQPTKESEEKWKEKEKGRAVYSEQQREEQTANPREDHPEHTRQEEVGKLNEGQERREKGEPVKQQRHGHMRGNKSTLNVKTPQSVDGRSAYDAHQAELRSILARTAELEKLLKKDTFALDNNKVPDTSKSTKPTVAIPAVAPQQAGDLVIKRKRVDDSEVEDANQDKSPNPITAPPRKTHRSSLLMASRTETQATLLGLAKSHASGLSMPNSHHRPIQQQHAPVDLRKEDNEGSDESEDYIAPKPLRRQRTGKIKGYVEVPSEDEDMYMHEGAGAADTTVSEVSRDDFSVRSERLIASHYFPKYTNDEGDIDNASGAPGATMVRRDTEFTAPLADIPDRRSAAKKPVSRECPMPENPKDGDILPIWVPALFSCDRCKGTGARCHVNIAVSPGSKSSHACGYCSSGKHKCSHTALSINMVSLLDAVAANTFIENTAHEIIALKQDVAALLDLKTQFSTVVKYMATSSDLVNLREEVQAMHVSVKQSISEIPSVVHKMGDDLGQLIRTQRKSTFTIKTPASKQSPASSSVANSSVPSGPNASAQRQPMSRAGIALAGPQTAPALHHMSQLRTDQDLAPAVPPTFLVRQSNDSLALPSILESDSCEETCITDNIGSQDKPATTFSFDRQYQPSSVMTNLEAINADISTESQPEAGLPHPGRRHNRSHSSQPSLVASSNKTQRQLLTTRSFFGSQAVAATYPVRRERTTSPSVTLMTSLTDVGVVRRSDGFSPGPGDHCSLSSGFFSRRGSSVPPQLSIPTVALPAFPFVREHLNVVPAKSTEELTIETPHIHIQVTNDDPYVPLGGHTPSEAPDTRTLLCPVTGNSTMEIPHTAILQQQSDNGQNAMSQSHSSGYRPSISQFESENICTTLTGDAVSSEVPELMHEPFTNIEPDYSHRPSAEILPFRSETNGKSPQYQLPLDYDVNDLGRQPMEPDLEKIIVDNISSAFAAVPPTDPISNASTSEPPPCNTDRVHLDGDLDNPVVSTTDLHSVGDGDDDSDLTPFDEDDDEGLEEHRNTPPVERPKIQTPRRNARRAVASVSKVTAQVAGRRSVARPKK